MLTPRCPESWQSSGVGSRYLSNPVAPISDVCGRSGERGCTKGYGNHRRPVSIIQMLDAIVAIIKYSRSGVIAMLLPGLAFNVEAARS